MKVPFTAGLAQLCQGKEMKVVLLAGILEIISENATDPVVCPGLITTIQGRHH